MSIELVGKFKVFEKDTLIIESNNLSEAIVFFIENNFKRIWISRYHGYLGDDIAFLKDWPFLREIKVDGPFDPAGLYALPSLTFLSYTNTNSSFILDLAPFKELKTCYIDLKSKVKGLNTLVNVEELRLFNLTVKEKDLTGITVLTKLKSLHISQSNIESLEGIESLVALSSLELHYFKNLVKIGAVASLGQTLNYLYVAKAKKITDFESVVKLKNLKVLAFNDCGSIPSVKFLDQLPKLEDFRFVGTDILDGDLSPLVRLKYAGFFNKKHYSMSYEELAKLHGHD